MNSINEKTQTEIKNKARIRLLDIFNIRSDAAEPAEIRERISSNAKIRGTNMYVLIAAIIIASIGLNMNSTAVIIGAMLISPLMGSIIGIGYGIATKQSEFTKNSLIGLLLQLSIALLTSTVYFAISPITAPSEEILARISPTVWDVLIALFGGAAGIIGLTRKDKANNIIPGVAIATALMPPVCTAGYGLANGKLSVFLGALDLFLINCLCIFATAYIFTKILKINDTPDDIKLSGKKVAVYLSIFALLVLLPSGFHAYDYVTNSAVENNISSFVSTEFHFEDTQVIKTSYNKSDKILTVSLVGHSVDENEIDEIRSKMSDYNLKDISLKVTQTKTEKTISIEEVGDIVDKKLEDSQSEINRLSGEITRLEALIEELQSAGSEAESETTESATQAKKESKKNKKSEKEATSSKAESAD